MKKVQVSFDYKGQNIYVFANYYDGCPANLEEPAEEHGIDILELFIGKTEFESTEDLALHLGCTEEEIYNLITLHINEYLNNEYFPNW